MSVHHLARSLKFGRSVSTVLASLAVLGAAMACASAAPATRGSAAGSPASAVARNPESSAATGDPSRQEWIELFNGRNLDGWTAKIAKHDVGENYAETFAVRDGVIEARYDKYDGDYDVQFGHLYYDTPYSYYLLQTEYRLLGSLYRGAPPYTLRNSGIMIHSQGPRTMPRDQNFPISVEMQLLGGLGDGKPRTTGNMCSPGTAVVFEGKLDMRHCINSSSKTYDGEQWVRAEVLVLGDSVVKQIINGDTVLTFTQPQMAAGVVTGFDPAQLQPGKLLSTGYIALQAEGQPVDFRNVRLLNLEGCTDRRANNFKSYYVKSEPAACRYDR